MARIPSFLSILLISFSAFSGSEKFLIPKAMVTMSKLLSLKGRFSAEHCTISIFFFFFLMDGHNFSFFSKKQWASRNKLKIDIAVPVKAWRRDVTKL